ncbi:ATP-dependent Clp protease ATP-binding subunit ClpX [Psychrobacillus sp. FSL K6-1464]|uniref:ATP-dependent Clp protease ATP-binding subunit ClpX n=1 Tax=Psychrobacillus sp. FSL K6-1464 TaxID=2921545 RepID=UPI0030F84DBF
MNCSFCQMPEGPKNKQLTADKVSICKTCAERAHEILRERKKISRTGLLVPTDMKAELDRYVIGQEEAKRTLAVAAYNHYKRLGREATELVEITKSNVLIWGPSGSGKTYLIQTLATLLDVPFVTADATTLTKAGYIGEDVESVLQLLLERADGDIKKAERGIIYIDEVDKLASNGDRKDPGGRSVQEALLKMMEDRDVKLSIGSQLQPKTVTLNTKNILFIFGGAFVDMIDSKGNKEDKVVGFLRENKTTMKKKSPGHEEFIKYGLIPEFMGRIPIIAKLNPLLKEDLRDIMTKPKNAVVKQYQALFEMDGIALIFEDNAIDYIAEQALQKKTGARGLKSIIESKMLEMMYEIPGKSEDKSLLVTLDMLVEEEMQTAN